MAESKTNKPSARPPGRPSTVLDVASGDEQVRAKQAKIHKGKPGNNGQK